MRRDQRPSPARRAGRLLDALAGEFDRAAPALDLLGEFLRHDSYARAFALSLIARARRGFGLPWETRRLAVLMLEHQLLKLPPGRAAEWNLILAGLHLKSEAAPDSHVHAFVLREGYTSTGSRQFVTELRRRLARLSRIHEQVRGEDTSSAALVDFIRLARSECKLTLGRYLFSPEEVVARILSQVNTSKGVADLNPFEPSYVSEEGTHALLVRLPGYEASILRLLCETAEVYWVNAATSAEINSLVEYPLTTVVLVVKPPGSCIEFEMKRAGRRGPHPLGVVHRRASGEAVPPSHRLDGGSAQEGLRYEAHSASRLSRVFRLAHGVEAPIPQYLSRTSIHYVPCGAGQATTLDYFSDPRLFGDGFREMRRAMDDSVASFGREYGPNLPEMPGVLGRTMQFLSYVTPGQAVLADTTSFRLDRLALYLSADGADEYFKQGLRVEYSAHDAKRLADDLLEEVLGVYRPPRMPFRGYAQYVASALRVAENRARADECYLSAVRQIGAFWGTLFAIRGHSLGESFVARNVGLRSVWQGGEWRVRLLFMDHDNLQTNEVTPRDFQAVGILKSLSADDVFIWGGPDDDSRGNNEMRCLKSVYRAGAKLIGEAWPVFREASLAAYRRTHAALEREPALRPLFHESFLGRVRDWDDCIARYLRARERRGGINAWRKETRAALTGKGYEEDLIGAILLSIETYGDFLAKHGYLFTS